MIDKLGPLRLIALSLAGYSISFYLNTLLDILERVRNMLYEKTRKQSYRKRHWDTDVEGIIVMKGLFIKWGEVTPGDKHLYNYYRDLTNLWHRMQDEKQKAISAGMEDEDHLNEGFHFTFMGYRAVDKTAFT